MIAEGTPVGDYKVVVEATAAGNNNYKSATKESTVTVTIGKAPNPAKVAPTASVMAGGHTVDLMENVTLNGAQGEVGFAFEGDNKGCTLDENGVLTSDYQAGTVTVMVTVGEEENYEALVAPITVTVGRMPNPLTYVEKQTVSVVYSDKAQTAELKKAENGVGEVTYAIYSQMRGSDDVDFFDLALDEEKMNLTIKAGTPVGIYKVVVRAMAEGDDDHKSGSKTASVTVNIDKAESVPAAVVAIHSTYDGSDKPLVSVTGVATGGTMLYASESGGFGESIPTGIEAGTYNVSYMVAGDDNHKDFGPASVQATIAKANASAVAPTALKPVYNGSAQALVEAGQTDDGTMEYALGTPEGASGKYSTSIPTGTEAGDYTVWYKVFGDEKYRDTEPESLLVTIRGIPSGVVVPDSLVYNGKAQKLVKSGKAEGGTLQYLVSNSTPGDAVIWSETVPTGTEAGDYRVWYRVKGDANHNDSAPAFVMSKISKVPIAPELGITGWTYGDEANDPTLTGNTGKGWETFLYSGERNGQYTGAVPTKAGSWFVKAKIEETDNYQGQTTDPVSFVILKRNITILADNKAGDYGDVIQELTYRTSGKIVDGDDLGIVLSTSAKEGSVPGEYPIALKWSEDANYSAVVKEGVYSIGKRSVTVTARDQVVKKGQGIATGVDRAVCVGLLNGHRLGTVTLKAASTANGLAANEIVLTNSTILASNAKILNANGKDVTANYVVDYVPGILTIITETTPTPTVKPTATPTPTAKPTKTPKPTAKPTAKPTKTPKPTTKPTVKPTRTPKPTTKPTVKPTGKPTAKLTGKPTAKPTGKPTAKPTGKPTAKPTGKPTAGPTGKPTVKPTGKPTAKPTGKPTAKPTGKPTAGPTGKPTGKPSGKPTAGPTGKPTAGPTTKPTRVPKPSVTPTAKPTAGPTVTPKPTGEPARPNVLLLAKLTTSGCGKRTLKLTWTRVEEADGYDVFFAHCGNDIGQRATVSGSGSCAYQFKNLEEGETYKGYVRAWKRVDGEKTLIAESPLVHAITDEYNSKWCNVKAIKLNRSSLVLKAGESKALKATLSLVKSGRKALQHEKPVRYYSSNPNVARVNSSGMVKAVGKGRCTIYAIAVNGERASVKITVK